MHERVRDILLRAWGRFVTERPWTVILASLLLAAVSVWLVVTDLTFKPDRSDLIDPELGWNASYAAYRSTFPRWDDLIVGLEGNPDDPTIDLLARDLADRLRDLPEVEDADAGFDPRVNGPRLFRMGDRASFDAALARLVAAHQLSRATEPNQALALATGLMRGEEESLDQLVGLELLLAPYVAALEGDDPSFADPSAAGPEWTPFRTDGGRIRIIQVSAAESIRNGAGIEGPAAAITAVRATARSYLEARGRSDVEVGVTGIPAIEADETAQSIRDSTVASIVAAVLITGLMIVVFRGVVVPLLAAASLLTGLSWSFGWLVVSVGHLQLLSVVFSVILLGLGIDFALHVVARLELVRDQHDSLPGAVSRVFAGVGPGLVTGAVTTAAAFGAVALTDFRGMAEMGLIAAGGILLCLVAMCSTFPALLATTRSWKRLIHTRPGGETAHFGAGRLDAFDARPGRTVLVSSVVVAVLLVAATNVRYDPNVLNLHPPGIESVDWETRIVDDGSRSAWSGLVLTDAAGAGPLVDSLRGLELVADVGAMGRLLPADRAERASALRAAAATTPPPLPIAAPGLEETRRQLLLIRVGLDGARDRVSGVAAERLDAIRASIARALRASARLRPADAEARWTALADAFDAWRTSTAPWLDAALDPSPMTPADLPRALREQWVGTDGSWLLCALPSSDPAGRPILEPDRLEPFVTSVRSVAPDVLGPPVQILESSRLIVREYSRAAVYALVAILIVLVLDFRSLTDALAALVPVSVGFIGALGAMGLVDVPLNFANIIVMPIILGIGVDAGVHTVHRWRVEPTRRPAGLSGGTGRGVCLTLLTTMIAFGCMLLAHHRGIRSLGVLMVAGLGFTLLACLTVQPALLRLRGPAADDDR